MADNGALHQPTKEDIELEEFKALVDDIAKLPAEEIKNVKLVVSGYLAAASNRTA